MNEAAQSEVLVSDAATQASTHSPLDGPAARENIAAVFEALGGVKSMVTWVKSCSEHEKAFYGTIYPKLIALEQGTEKAPIVHKLNVRFV